MTEDVVRREQMPKISREMTQLADRHGDPAVDEYARNRDVLAMVSRRLGGRPVEWVPDRMLWRALRTERS